MLLLVFRLDAFRVDAYRVDAFRLDAFRLDAFHLETYRVDAFHLDACGPHALLLTCGLLAGAVVRRQENGSSQKRLLWAETTPTAVLFQYVSGSAWVWSFMVWSAYLLRRSQASG